MSAAGGGKSWRKEREKKKTVKSTEPETSVKSSLSASGESKGDEAILNTKLGESTLSEASPTPPPVKKPERIIVLSRRALIELSPSKVEVTKSVLEGEDTALTTDQPHAKVEEPDHPVEKKEEDDGGSEEEEEEEEETLDDLIKTTEFVNSSLKTKDADDLSGKMNINLQTTTEEHSNDDTLAEPEEPKQSSETGATNAVTCLLTPVELQKEKVDEESPTTVVEIENTCKNEMAEHIVSVELPTSTDESEMVELQPQIENMFLEEKLDEESLQNRTEEEEESLAKERKLEEDRAFLTAYITEARERLAEKARIRASNLAIAKDRPELETAKLDSSLKKNIAFIKKLRPFTESQFPVLARELNCLNLSRYVGEAANALLEARLKMADVSACVQLCCALHTKYADFSSSLLAGCTKMLKERDDKISNLSKLRVDLRFYAELVSAGIFSQKEGLPLLGNLLTSLVNGDKKEHRNASVITSFCRYCGEDYMGLLPAKVQTMAMALGLEESVPRSDFLPKERQKNVCQLMKDYYASLTHHILQQHKLIQREERHNRRLLETRGEVEVGRLTALSLETATLDRLLQHASALADHLHQPLPVLPQDQNEGAEGGLVLGEGSMGSGESGVDAGDLWEDEDVKAFYTHLPELKALLPSILYRDSEKTAPTEGDQEGEVKVEEKEEDLEGDDEVQDASQLAEKEEEEEKDDEDKSVSSKITSQKALFISFLNSLPSCISRDLMDSAALDFCLNFNTKPLRMRLSRALFLVPRHRQDLLPFYARLVAALQPLMPDLPMDLMNRLKMDFKFKVKKKDQINVESKVKVCRFLGELTKFSVLPCSDCLACLRMLLADFRHHHIEMACAILESAGRFLYRTPATHHRTKAILEQMMRKKTVMSFEHRYDTMIENAYYYVNPPERRELVEVAPLPPLLLFVRHLITERLNKTSVEKVLRLVRKLDWNDKTVADYCVGRLTASWDVKFYNIRCIANLVSGLVLYHEWVGPAVVDGVLEDVRVGLETNAAHMNQRRVAAVKYLAELYNYKVIESNVIFKTLYSLISFGAGLDTSLCQELDPPEQLLRLRLVVTVLDTCGVFFSAGHSKRKLDCFLTYFQYYYQLKRACWCGSDVFPAEYEQAVRGCLSALRPDLALHDTIEDALNAVNALNTQLIARAVTQAPELRRFFPSENEDTLATIAENEDVDINGGFSDMIELDDGDDDDDDDAEADDDAERHRGGGGGGGAGGGTQDDEDGSQEDDEDDDDDSDDDDSKREGDSSTQDDTQPDHPPAAALEPIACPEDDEFLSEFERLVSDSLLEHSRERPAPAPLQLPLASRGANKKTYDQLLDESRSPEEDEAAPVGGSGAKGMVQFVVMARGAGGGGGGKQPQQLATIAVPENCEMVTKMRERERHQAEERRSVKRVTLQMTERQEEEEAQQELLAQQRANSAINLHRERRVRYQHPKGAPDADLIFGTAKHRPANTK